MNNASVANRGARHTGAIAAALAATLAALLAVLILAKPSGAQDTPLITVEPTEVGFGAVEVGTTGDPVRTIYIRNTSGSRLVIGGIDILGANAGDFSIVNPPLGNITLDRDGTYELQVAFSPTANGTRVAELGFDVVGSGATLPTVNLTGTGTQEPPTNQQGTKGCTIIGTNDGEVLTGTPRRDVICALGGADRANGLGSRDVIRGGSGNDRLTDKAGRDKLLGQRGRDTLIARDGRRGDLLVGGPRRDKAVKDRGDRARSI